MFERFESLRGLPGTLWRLGLGTLVGIVATIALLGAYAPVANAYVLGVCRWVHTPGATMSLGYQWGPEIDFFAPENTNWRDAFVIGAQNWTATPTRLNIYSGGSHYTFDTYFANDGSYGGDNVVYNTQTGNCVSVWAAGNRGHLTSQYAAEHTAAHEIGHGLPLEHAGSGVLMEGSYNGVKWPQADDINGANAMYP